jgi:putative transposase
VIIEVTDVGRGHVFCYEQSVIQRAFRYRLYPTTEQARLMENTANARRFVYNLALEQRRDFWRQAKRSGVTLDYVTQGHQVTQLRAENEWLAAVSSTTLTQALRDLDRNFVRFFRGAGFPSFQSRDRHMSFRHIGTEVRFVELSAKWCLIRLPKIGMVKMRITRPWRGRILSATFARDALGWHVTLACEIEHEASPNLLPAVGIDRGVANTLALSTGELLSTPDVSQIERRKRKAQRVLARRTRGSNRYRKQRARVARLSGQMARIRADWQHRASTDIARRFGTVALEDLKTRNMVRAGRGIARAILEQGWHGFERKLAYKLEERGGTLVKANPAYSSQTCAVCGAVDKASRESQSRFACRHCGSEDHADVNAAKIILRRSSPVVEGSAYAPDEARTVHALAA